MLELFIFFWFFLFSFTLAVGLFFVVLYFGGIWEPDSEKSSTYECGFEPFSDSRKQFDIQFYNTAIVFVVFDIEFIYLFPFLSSRLPDGFRVYIYIVVFLLLVLGLVYELQTEALDWNKKSHSYWRF